MINLTHREVFRTIEGSNGYEVSQDGNVRRNGYYLKKHINQYRGGYEDIMIKINDSFVRRKIHRLVAFAFPEICGEYFEGAEIDHLNTITNDNRAINLIWTDRKGNMNNPITKQKIKDSYTQEQREISRKRMIENNPAKQEGFWTEERRNAVSERMKGHMHTPEAIEKMSQAAKGRYLGGKSVKAKRVKCIAPDGTETIYDAFRTAERATGISHNTIRTYINNNKTDKYGNLWKLL